MFPVSFREGAGLRGDRKPRTRASCSSNAHDQALPGQIGVKSQVEGKERFRATVVVAVLFVVGFLSLAQTTTPGLRLLLVRT